MSHRLNDIITRRLDQWALNRAARIAADYKRYSVVRSDFGQHYVADLDGNLIQRTDQLQLPAIIDRAITRGDGVVLQA